MADLIGQSFGRYQIREKLGEGGMAVVYEAYDTRLGREVALKAIQTDAFAPERVGEILKRFEREARILASLTHPNIVKVLDTGEQDGIPYLVMEWIRGRTLKDRLQGQKGQPLSYDEAAQLLAPIARALEYAHHQDSKIVHRDVKPSNILITQSGTPMLSDFGISKVLGDAETQELTSTGMGIGTPEYMAPEQATSRDADHRADIYALGVVFYEMVTGRKPYEADTPMAVMIMKAAEPLPRPRKFIPDLPEAVERFLLKSLARDPGDRYQDMGMVAAALDEFSRGELPAAARPGLDGGLFAGLASNWSPAVLVAGSLLVVCALAGAGTILGITRLASGFNIPDATATRRLTREPISTESAEAAPAVAPSPEGWIAFFSENNLWLIHPDGSGLTQITGNPVPTFNDFGKIDMEMRWSPDGSKLAFSEGGNLYVLDIGTFSTTLLMDGVAGGFDWSLAGDEIIYDVPMSIGERQFDYHNDGFWVVDIESGEKNLLVKTSDGAPAMLMPRWGLDGKHIMFSDPGGFEPGGVHVVEVNTGEIVTLLPAGAHSGTCVWSKSETVAACIRSNELTDREPEVFFVDGDGAVVRQTPLPDGAKWSSVGPWSPDGKQLAITYYTGFLGTTETPSTLKAHTYILTLSGASFRSFEAGFATDWSPDGRWTVAWDSTWRSGENVLPMAIVDTLSGSVFSLPNGYQPAWQPGGQTAALVPSVQQPGSMAAGLPCIDTDITLKDTDSGNLLQMCAGGELVEIGPLADGAHAVGPNGKFFVYCTDGGDVLAGRIGETWLEPIGDVKDFSIIVRGEAPDLDFKFHGDHPYTVQIFEGILEQNKTLSIPRFITTPN